MSFAKPIFTTRGKQIELQGIEGQQIIFTKIKIGDGRITTQSPSQLTDLINVIAEAPITSLKRYDAYAAIRSVFQNIDVPEAFWWREVGLFATDPATGEEVLYAYQNAYDTAEYITPSSLVTKKINWTIYIDDGENLGADIHKKMVFCSVEDLDEHNDLEGAHEPAFTAHNEDEGAHESRFQQYIKKTGDVMSGIITHTAGEMIMNSYRDDMNLTICGGTDYGSGGHLALYGKNTSHTGHGKGAVALCAVTDEDRQDLVVTPTEAFFIEHMQSENKVCKYIVKTINGVGADSAGNVDIIPVGALIEWTADTTPDGWLLCDGSAVSRTLYAKLFSVIGTTWGTGDGSTTFNLPNSIGRFAEGASTSGSYKSAGLPNIYGTVDGYFGYSATSGVFKLKNWSESVHAITAGAGYHSFELNANSYNPIYGASTTVQPKSFTVRYIIKY